MKFTIDLEEFYLESDEGSENIETELKRFIVNTVVMEIYKKIKPDIEAMTSIEIKNNIDASIAVEIEKIVSEFCKSGMVNDRYDQNKKTPFLQWIDSTFQEQLTRLNLDALIKKKADTIAAGLEKRYDLLFASQIVSNLNKAGFLRSDAAALLLQSSDPNL